MRRVRVFIALLTAVLVATTFGACGGSSSTQQSRTDVTAGGTPAAGASTGASDGSLTVAQGVDPRTMTPWTSVTAEQSVTSQIVEKLFELDLSTHQIKPVIADRWRWVDVKTVDITLRQGLTFSNGEPVDAAAVVLGLKYAIDPKVGGLEFPTQGANVARATERSDGVVRVTFKKPASSTVNMSNLAQIAYVVPPKYLRETGIKGYVQKPVGSGPFTFVSRVRDSTITLAANPTYKGEGGPAPKVKQLVFKILPEPGARIAALRGGDADLITDLPPDLAKPLEGAEGIKVTATPGLRVMELQVDAKYGMSKISANRDVRLALLYALDRKKIIDAIFGGEGTPANQLVTPEYVGYVKDLPQLSYDPDKVKQLLTQAGYPNGITLPLFCPSGRYLNDREACQAISSELGKVGVKAPLTVQEVGQFFQNVLDGKAGPMIYIGRLNPSLNALDQLTESTCELQDSYKCDKAFDKRFDAATHETDAERQRAMTEQLVRDDLADPTRIPLWYLNDIYATSSRVTGWQPRKDQVLTFYGVGLG